jgi:hypothetical protein
MMMWHVACDDDDVICDMSQATREVQHRMHVQVEEARMRHEQHVARVAMANRALDFRRCKATCILLLI